VAEGETVSEVVIVGDVELEGEGFSLAVGAEAGTQAVMRLAIVAMMIKIDAKRRDEGFIFIHQ
jgi:hypothetical protein